MADSPVLVPHKRNAYASMAMRQGLKFPCKALSLRDTMQVPLVAIHQPVLKSTTRAWLVALVDLVCFVCLVEQNKPEKPDESDR